MEGEYPQSRQYTWVRVSNNREAARFDRIYISSSISSTLIHSNISPVGFTDHHFISIEMVSLPGARVKSCWAFNNKHLRYSFFCQSFFFFLATMESEKRPFCFFEVAVGGC